MRSLTTIGVEMKMPIEEEEQEENNNNNYYVGGRGTRFRVQK